MLRFFRRVFTITALVLIHLSIVVRELHAWVLVVVFLYIMSGGALAAALISETQGLSV